MYTYLLARTAALIPQLPGVLAFGVSHVGASLGMALSRRKPPCLRPHPTLQGQPASSGCPLTLIKSTLKAFPDPELSMGLSKAFIATVSLCNSQCGIVFLLLLLVLQILRIVFHLSFSGAQNHNHWCQKRSKEGGSYKRSGTGSPAGLTPSRRVGRIPVALGRL